MVYWLKNTIYNIIENSNFDSISNMNKAIIDLNNIVGLLIWFFMAFSLFLLPLITFQKFIPMLMNISSKNLNKKTKWISIKNILFFCLMTIYFIFIKVRAWIFVFNLFVILIASTGNLLLIPLPLTIFSLSMTCWLLVINLRLKLKNGYKIRLFFMISFILIFLSLFISIVIFILTCGFWESQFKLHKFLLGLNVVSLLEWWISGGYLGKIYIGSGNEDFSSNTLNVLDKNQYTMTMNDTNNNQNSDNDSNNAIGIDSSSNSSGSQDGVSNNDNATQNESEPSMSEEELDAAYRRDLVDQMEDIELYHKDAKIQLEDCKDEIKNNKRSIDELEQSDEDERQRKVQIRELEKEIKDDEKRIVIQYKNMEKLEKQWDEVNDEFQDSVEETKSKDNWENSDINQDPKIKNRIGSHDQLDRRLDDRDGIVITAINKYYDSDDNSEWESEPESESDSNSNSNSNSNSDSK